MADSIKVDDYFVGYMYGELDIPITENDCLHSVEVNSQLFLLKQRDDKAFIIVKERGEKKIKSLNEYHGCDGVDYEVYPLCSYHTADSESDSFIYDKEGNMYEGEKLKDAFERQKRKIGRRNGIGFYRPLRDFLSSEYNFNGDEISLELVHIYILKYNMSKSGKSLLLPERIYDSIKLLLDNDIYFESNLNEEFFKSNDSNIINQIKTTRN